MKNAILYKDTWLMKGSTCYTLFREWKDCTDDKQAKIARKKFEDHFKLVELNYEKSLQS